MSLFFDSRSGGGNDPAAGPPDELGNWPLRSETRPVRTSRWHRHTPSDQRVQVYQAANPAEAAAAAEIAHATAETAVQSDGKSGRLEYRVEVCGSKLTFSLKPSGDADSDLVSGVMNKIEAAWEAAFRDGVLTMKPERTQITPDDDPLTPTPWYLEPCSVARVSPAGVRVSYHQTLLARYSFAGAADAMEALASAVTFASDEEDFTLVKAIAVGKSVYFRLSSKVSQTLTEVEYSLAYAIEDVLAGEEVDS